jgi:hypothetical protein
MYSFANISQVASSSTSRTSSISPNASGFPATCPTDDRKTIRDNSGVAYQVLCASDVGAVNGGGESGPSAPSSFNDCFALCTAAVVTGGAGRCTGFTYVGQVNGAGGGTCYLKSGTSYTIGSAGTNFVGAIRQADPVSSSSLSSVVLASTTASSVVVSSSSAVVVSSSSAVLPSSSSSVLPSSSSAVVPASTTSSSVGVATPTPTNACYPFDDRDTQNFGGTTYMIACSAIIYPYASFAQQPAPNNWNDCPAICNTLAGCTGFWYNGGVIGVGPGTCFFSNAASSGFVRANNTQVAGRKYPQPAGYNDNVVLPATTTTTTTTSSPIQYQTQTLTYTTVSYATVTTTSSYPVTNTVVSTFVQNYTTSYPVTITQTSTAPGQFRSDTVCLVRSLYCPFGS